MYWKAHAKQLWPDLRSYAVICLAVLRQTMKKEHFAVHLVCRTRLEMLSDV